MSYTKLFQSLLTSTIWGEDDQTRIVWITMLALADQHGEVNATIPGLARQAVVPLEAVERAIEKLLSADPYSRTPDDDGRRIEPIDGGWLILNHAKYREMASRDEQKEKAAKRLKKWREKQARNDVKRNETVGNGLKRNETVGNENETQTLHIAEAEAEADLSPLAPQGETCSNPDGLNHGKSGKTINQQALEVYAYYPRKIGRKAALTKIATAIRQHGYDTILAATIGYRKAREAADPAYTPHPATWYGQERFLDDPDTWNSTPAGRKTWKELGKEADHFAEGGDVF